MTTSAPSASFYSSRLFRWLLGFVLVVLFWFLLPPFRIVVLDESGAIPQSDGGKEAFDPAAFVEHFWEETLIPGLDEAVPLDTLLPALRANPMAARQEFGQAESRYYFLQGEGTVLEIKGRRAVLDAYGSQVNLLIAPPVFGNTLRDGTGLLDVNEFAGLEAFNAISAVLNERVEKSLMPNLESIALVGARLSFVACAKAPETLDSGPVLELIPLRVEVAQ